MAPDFLRICSAAGSVLAGILVTGCDGETLETVTNPLLELPTWAVDRDLEIGREDDSNYALVPVGGLAVSPHGDVYISQPQARHIRVFDRDGRFRRTIGRGGEGPGEFLRLGEVGFIGDTLWAVDLRGEPFLQFFTVDARPTRMRRLPQPEDPYLGGMRYYPMSDGGFLMPAATGGELLEQDHDQPWLRWNAQDSLVASFPGYSSLAATILQYTVTVSGRSMVLSGPVIPPLSTRSWVGLAPDASVFVRAAYDPSNLASADVTVAMYNPDGDTLATTSLVLPRQPVSSEVAD